MLLVLTGRPDSSSSQFPGCCQSNLATILLSLLLHVKLILKVIFLLTSTQPKARSQKKYCMLSIDAAYRYLFHVMQMLKLFIILKKVLGRPFET